MEPSYEKLDVTRLARELITIIYRITKDFPKEERYGLADQLRRAAISVLLNIAEGSIRNTHKDFARFVRTALGSLIEVDAAIKISHELGFISKQQCETVLEHISPLYFKLIGLDKYLRK